MNTSHRKKFIVVTICLFILLLAAYAVNIYIDWANSPVSQTIKTAPSNQSTTVSSELKILKNEVFETKIPVKYRVQTVQKPTAVSINHLTAFDPVNSSKQIAITTGALPSGGVTDIADYKYRVTYPNIYTKTTLKYFNNIPAFTTAQGETTFILTRGVIYVTISVTNPSGSAASTDDMLRMLDENWVWL
jgi:hypothetical protein